MRVVLDASVVVKWLLADPEREADTHIATRLVARVIAGEIAVLQPVHWLLEVGAVLTRESPETAIGDIMMLRALAFPVSDDPLVLKRALELARELRQHVFDTAYHAIALEMPETTLVTADRRYLTAARAKGRITSLRQFDSATG